MSNFSDALQNVQTIYDADIAELSAVNAANEPVRASLEAAQAQLEQNKLALDTMSAELTALRKHMADAPNDTRGAELEASIAGLTAERDGMLKQLSTANERIRRRDADIAKLQAALAKKLEAEAASAKKRAVFQADPKMVTPDKFAPRFAKVLEWGEHSRSDNFKDYLPTQDVEPRTGRPLAGYIEHLMYNIHWMAHFPSVIALAEVWIALLNRFPTWAVTYIALESSLVHDSLAKSLYILGLHKGMHATIDQGLKVLETYFAVFEADRLRDAARAGYKNPGPGVHGKPLFHPTISDYNAYEFRFLMWGKKEDRAAADYLCDCLWDCLSYVTAPDGKEIAIPSHGVGQRYYDQNGKRDYLSAHFTVYTSDSMSDLEIAALMGFKFATSRVVKALSRTLYWTYPTQGGPDSHQYARDMGGGSLWEGKKDRQVVQFRDGSSVKGKWDISTNGEVAGDYAMQRGLTYITAYRNPELPNYKQELINLDKRAVLGRHGIQQALLAWEMAEAGGRL